jgi:hypothetical protein
MRITRKVHEGNSTQYVATESFPENADVKQNKLKEVNKYVKT